MKVKRLFAAVLLTAVLSAQMSASGCFSAEVLCNTAV